jgi:hypothetical protein
VHIERPVDDSIQFWGEQKVFWSLELHVGLEMRSNVAFLFLKCISSINYLYVTKLFHLHGTQERKPWMITLEHF